MTTAFKITYRFENKEYITVWYGHNANTVKGLFQMWHKEYEIISIEKVRK